MVPVFRIIDLRWFVLALLVFSGCESLRLGQQLFVATNDTMTDGGSATRENTSEEAPAPPLSIRWERTTEGGYGPGSPLVAGGFVIVATRAGNVDVVELRDGNKVGSVSLGEAIEGSPVLVDGRLLIVPVAGGKDGLVAYNLTNGGKVWTLRDNLHAASLLYTGDLIVAAALDGTVRGIDPLSGQERWSEPFGQTNAYYAAPTQLASGMVLVSDDSGGLVVFDPADGAMQWRRELATPVMRAPASQGGRLFVPTTLGRLEALEEENGASIWTHRGPPTARFTTPAVDERFLIVGATDGIVRCLNPATGEEIWRYEFDGNVSGAPLLADDIVYVGTMDERIAALDATTGELLWEDELPGRAKSAFAARNGILIVLAEPKFVIAYEAARVALSDGN